MNQDAIDAAASQLKEALVRLQAAWEADAKADYAIADRKSQLIADRQIAGKNAEEREASAALLVADEIGAQRVTAAEREIVGLILDLANGHKCQGALFLTPYDTDEQLRRRKIVGSSTIAQESSPRHTLYVFPTGNGDKADRLIELIRHWTAKAKQDGKRDGERFIAQLAGGQFTVDELNDHQVKLHRR